MSVRAVSRHCPNRQTNTLSSKHCPDLCFFFLMGFVFCDSYYPTDSGGQHGWRGPTRGGPARAGGSSTGALCTKFTLVMMMLTNVRIPSTKITMLTCWHVDKRVGGKRMWVYSRKTWNFVCLTIKEKISHTTSWEVILSPTMGAMKKVNPQKVQRLTTNVMWQAKG